MGQKNILIVEDDLDVIESMKVVLESKKYFVSAAYDGDEGLKKAQAEKPDLIILDVMMRRVTEGYDVSQKLRKNPETRNIPILMVSAIMKKNDYMFSKNIPEGFLSVDDFAEKPIQPEDLISRAERLLSK